ncbi:hypothetical protein [Syntrophomonas palmitatica]|uniref:hypothetical protein n=1 Tax=Syntrophomonas palmitatica TaxID=402877 RepID=UPI0006CF5BB8|nr:hypothetical protein [Syntrophomonas palmitatica]
MLKRLILILLAMGLIITGMCPYRALAVQQPPQRQVVIFAVEGLDPGDIDPALTPCMWKMTQAGAIGLLNTPSAGLRNTVNTYCTISAGKPALAANDARLNFAARESYNCELAGDIFTRNTGAAPDSNNIIISSIAAITRNNQERNLAQPGRLGDQIHSLGCRTAFIGNSDLPGYYSRAGALLLMDSRGIVDAGAIDDNLSQTSSVMGLATNYQKLVREAVKHKHEVLLVEFGDLYRLDNAGTLFSKPVMSRERKHILKSIDKAMAQIVQNKGLNRTCWYIISPSTSNAAEERGELLTPLIIVKPGFHGILSGISTRRAGIVASLVVSDSILNCLDNNLPESIAANNNPDQLSYIKSLNQRLVFDYVNQAWFMTVVSALIVLMLFLIFYFTFKQKYRTLSKFLMGFVAAVPLSLLLISFNIVNKVSLAAAFLICTALISLLSMYFAKRFKSNLLLPIFLATAICIALDLILGLGMLERSMMSYRIMRGSRYYGLGNEYMGVFISAALGFSAIFLNNAYSAWRRFGVIVFL